MVVPPIVLVIPLFQLTVELGQLNTYRSVVFVYTGLLLPFSTFLLASVLPHDAARRCSRRPASTARATSASGGRSSCRSRLPALATVATVQALWVWNEVLIAVVFLQSEEPAHADGRRHDLPLPLHLDIPLVMAGMVWATIPMVVLYLLLQRFFIRGLTAGAVKG